MPARSTAPLIRAGFFAFGSVMIIVFALGWFPQLFRAMGLTESFAATTRAHPFIMGFVKLFFLGTLGEFLKFRIAKGSFDLDKILQRAIVWGVWGLWFTLAFPAFSAAVEALIQRDLWPGRLPGETDTLPLLANLWLALSKSLWINVFGMYALGMMVGHEYANHLIATGWRSWSFNSFADKAQPRFILAFLPLTLFFWIPAHTFTFAMPAEWRVFIAAVLAIALGFFLSVGRRT